jgi:hypothetical protein
MYVYRWVYIYILQYIYLYIERETKRKKETDCRERKLMNMSQYIYIFISSKQPLHTRLWRGDRHPLKCEYKIGERSRGGGGLRVGCVQVMVWRPPKDRSPWGSQLWIDLQSCRSPHQSPVRKDCLLDIYIYKNS